MLGLDKEEVILLQRDFNYWNSLFQKEKQILEEKLSGKYVAVEHVGSTAIPSIPTKPIIDIAIGVISIEEPKAIISALEPVSYQYRCDRGSKTRLLFIKTEGEKRTHHLHVEIFGSIDWNDHIDFRDCMLTNPELKQEYANLKINLAKMYPHSREDYTLAKAYFIKAVLDKYRSGTLH